MPYKSWKYLTIDKNLQKYLTLSDLEKSLTLSDYLTSNEPCTMTGRCWNRVQTLGSLVLVEADEAAAEETIYGSKSQILPVHNFGANANFTMRKTICRLIVKIYDHTKFQTHRPNKRLVNVGSKLRLHVLKNHVLGLLWHIVQHSLHSLFMFGAATASVVARYFFSKYI